MTIRSYFCAFLRPCRVKVYLDRGGLWERPSECNLNVGVTSLLRYFFSVVICVYLWHYLLLGVGFWVVVMGSKFHVKGLDSGYQCKSASNI